MFCVELIFISDWSLHSVGYYPGKVERLRLIFNALFEWSWRPNENGICQIVIRLARIARWIDFFLLIKKLLHRYNIIMDQDNSIYNTVYVLI